MGGYIANFTVYTLAMLGLIFFALFMYKKFFCGSAFGKKSDFLGIEESINLAPRKQLYVVRAGKEKFLVAADVNNTNLIAKLDDNSSKNRRIDAELEDLPVIVDFPKKEQPVIKEMLKKINEI